MLEAGQKVEDIVMALLMVGYDVFMRDEKHRDARTRIAMFMEIARGTGANMEGVPRDIGLPSVKPPSGGRPWQIDDRDV